MTLNQFLSAVIRTIGMLITSLIVYILCLIGVEYCIGYTPWMLDLGVYVALILWVIISFKKDYGIIRNVMFRDPPSNEVWILTNRAVKVFNNDKTAGQRVIYTGPNVCWITEVVEKGGVLTTFKDTYNSDGEAHKYITIERLWVYWTFELNWKMKTGCEITYRLMGGNTPEGIKNITKQLLAPIDRYMEEMTMQNQVLSMVSHINQVQDHMNAFVFRPNPKLNEIERMLGAQITGISIDSVNMTEDTRRTMAADATLSRYETTAARLVEQSGGEMELGTALIHTELLAGIPGVKIDATDNNTTEVLDIRGLPRELGAFGYKSGDISAGKTKLTKKKGN